MNFAIDKHIFYQDVGKFSQTFSFHKKNIESGRDSYSSITEKTLDLLQSLKNISLHVNDLHANLKEEGTDLFYMGQYKLRLPFVYSLENAQNDMIDEFAKEFYDKAHCKFNLNNDPEQQQIDKTNDEEYKRKRDIEFQDTEETIKNQYINISLEEANENIKFFNSVNKEFYTNVFNGESQDGSGDLVGEFALGPGSKLWQYWDKYTITVDAIIFGMTLLTQPYHLW